MEIYAAMEKVGNGCRSSTRRRCPTTSSASPPRLDHCLLTSENVPDIARFMQEALQFRLTEQMVSNEGHQLIVFFERSHQPHDVAFTRGANGGLHHFAFWLDSWADVGRAADILRMNGIDIDVGPTRHGITRPHDLLLRPGREPQRGLHRRVQDRRRLGDDHLDRGPVRQGAVLLREPRRRLVRVGLHLRRRRWPRPATTLRPTSCATPPGGRSPLPAGGRRRRSRRSSPGPANGPPAGRSPSSTSRRRHRGGPWRSPARRSRRASSSGPRRSAAGRPRPPTSA